MDEDERRARLAVRHRLTPASRTDDLVTLAESVVAFHSSDPVTAYLSPLVRMRTPELAAVDSALYEQRSLIRHHAMRRTLWVASAATVRLVHAAATRSLIGPQRRRLLGLLAEGGIEQPAAWLDDARPRVLAHLREHGPTAARVLGQQIPDLGHKLVLGVGTKWAQTISAHTRVLLQLGFEGAVLRARPAGRWVSGAYAYAAADQWLPGGLGAEDERTAAAALTRQWLRSFGPATTEDLRWWMGWTVTTARRALADAGARPLGLGAGEGWLAADDEPVADPGPWVALLPSLDPTVMGWKRRDWYLPEAAADAFDRNGNAGPTIWVDGRVVGAWAQLSDGSVRLHYFERVAAARRREIDDRVRELRSWVGDTRFTVRFPGRINAELLA